MEPRSGTERLQGSPLPFREDHSGLTGALVAAAVVLTIAAAAAIVLFHDATGAISSVGAVLEAVLVLSLLIAWMSIYQAWVVGVRIDGQQVRIGGVRRAEGRERHGKPAPESVRVSSRLSYVYRCPLTAIRRVRVVRGLGPSFNPLRGTDYPPALRQYSTRVRRLGWLRGIPLVQAGLLLEVDPMQAAWPSIHTPAWHLWLFVPPNSSSGGSWLWFTPTSRPDAVEAALHEALAWSGRRLDDQGHVVEGADASALTGPRGTPPEPVPDRAP